MISLRLYLFLQIEVDPEYHPKIIGRRGAVITKIREDHNVQINFPKKGDPEEHIITITGYEQDTYNARDSIMKIVNELVSGGEKCSRLHLRYDMHRY